MISQPFLLVAQPMTFETTDFELAAAPGVNLTNDNMDMEWRSVGLNDTYVVLGCLAVVDTIAVLHTNQRTTDTIRVRAGATWDETATNSVYDSGVLPAFEGNKEDPYTTKTIIDLGQSVQAPFWRIDFFSPGHPDGQVKAARVVMGERFEVPTGINYGWEKVLYDDSIITTGPNYEDVQEYPSRPGVKATIGQVDEADFVALDPFLMRAGFKKPVLFAPEPDNLDTAQHWTVYGRMKGSKWQNPYHKWWEIDIEVSGLRA
ncbi:hypothetical protein HT136_08465 [Novosphingobium profundi]|uniref:hypothetical protein n=1 Tax=Novosphingobium profundi TaxID=1774954 RepID=UPI001BD9419A|nr:hypothetical protein [Novosphingobium profundi]MBT0668401.1 hypothetical protein [Novosphingobium profundi]